MVHLSHGIRAFVLASVCMGSITGAAVLASGARAPADERGEIAEIEQGFLHALIDHLYAALRMTELTAGTELTAPGSSISPDDRTAPSPQFEATDARAHSQAVRSLARRNNRIQREEILVAQRLLLETYGQVHVPELSRRAMLTIHRLSVLPPGPIFERAFLRLFTRHHYEGLKLVVDSLAARDLEHRAFDRLGRAILTAQLSDIDEMRELLCAYYADCEFVPFRME